MFAASIGVINDEYVVCTIGLDCLVKVHVIVSLDRKLDNRSGGQKCCYATAPDWYGLATVHSITTQLNRTKNDISFTVD